MGNLKMGESWLGVPWGAEALWYSRMPLGTYRGPTVERKPVVPHGGALPGKEMDLTRVRCPILQKGHGINAGFDGPRVSLKFSGCSGTICSSVKSDLARSKR